MLVTCPSCQSGYRVQDAASVGGRRMRCARCGEEWAGASEIALPSPIFGIEDIVPLDAIDALDAEAAATLRPGKKPRRAFRQERAASPPAQQQRPHRAGAAAGAVRPVAAFAALAVVAIGLLVAARTTVVRVAPSLASLYGAVGLGTNIRGLELAGVTSAEEIDEGVPLLTVTGAIQNVTDAAIDVPRLRIAVRADDAREIYAWTTVASRPTLAPGESATFRARLASPPAEGRSIAVRFFGKQDLVAHASR